MHTKYSAGELNQNNDDMSYVTRFTGKTGTIVYTQHTRFNITEEFLHAVEKPRLSLRQNGQLRPLDIYKTSWTQTVINQVSGKIWNIST